jgi:hypothetical protein
MRQMAYEPVVGQHLRVLRPIRTRVLVGGLSVPWTAMPVPPFVQKHALNGVTALLFGVTIWRLGVSPELLAILTFIFGLAYVGYGALARHLIALAVAVATCIRKRKLHPRCVLGPPLIAGTSAVVLFGA